MRMIRSNWKPAAVVGCPHHVGFDAPDDRQANDDAVTARQDIGGIVDHEPVGGDVGDVQLEVALGAVFGNDRIIDGMPCPAPLFRHR